MKRNENLLPCFLWKAGMSVFKIEINQNFLGDVKMTAASLTIILIYLLGLEAADKRNVTCKKMEQYKKDVGCYLFNL